MAIRKSLPSLPSLPSTRASRNRPVHACACGGCGFTTKSVWHPGHDGHCTGWAVRILNGVIASLDEVPASVRAGVAIRLKAMQAADAADNATEQVG